LFGGVVQTPPATGRRECVCLWFRAERPQL
jgi:hypothetical protein